MTAAALKTGLAATMALLGFISSLAPRFAMATSERLFSLGNMMASGVLLAASLVHQLPDAQVAFENHVADGVIVEFPWAGFICGLAFAAFLFLEEILHTFVEGGECEGESASDFCDAMEINGLKEVVGCNHCHGMDGHKHGLGELSKIQRDKNAYDSLSEDFNEEEVTQALFGHGMSKSHIHHIPVPNLTFIRSTSIESQSSCRNRDRFIRRPSANISNRANDSWLQQSVLANSIKSHHHEEHVAHHLEGSFVSSVGLLLALSVHSILEGIGVGLLDATGAKSAAIAILAHKAFAGYALGSTLTAASGFVSSASYFAMICVFSLSTPTGIMLALIWEERYNPSPVFTAVIQATVAGTFLYIALFEVCMKELLVCRAPVASVQGPLPDATKRFEMAKLFSLLTGYVIMSILALWV